MLVGVSTAEMTVLPAFDSGSSSRLSFVWRQTDNLLILRLWRSPLDLRGTATSTVPVWYGSVVDAQPRRPGEEATSVSSLQLRQLMPAQAVARISNTREVLLVPCTDSPR